MMQHNKICYFFLLIIFVFHNICYSQPRAFICGPDEDGCFVDQVQYCACIPYDEANYAKPYCLDFNNLQCEPLANVPNCPKGFIYEDQSSCIATIFQSESEPPCPTVTQEFCKLNHITTCNINGDRNSCKKS